MNRALATLLIVATLAVGCSLRLGRSAARVDRQATKEAGPPDRLRELQARSAADPRQPYWPFAIAQIHAAADSTSKAESALETALARDRLYAPALSLRSKLLYRAGRHEQAVAMLEAARSSPGAFRDGVPPELLAGLALHLEALGRFDLARGVMAEMPKHPRDETATATVYLTLRAAPDSAVGPARAAARERPRSAASQNNYGITLLRAGDPAAARRAFQTAIALDPRLPGPYYNLAILEKFYLLDDAAATRWFKLYWERSHDDPDGLASAFGRSEPKGLAKKGDDP